MKKFWQAIWMACACLFAAHAWSADNDYRMGTGDVLRITVYGQPDLTTEARVGEGGGINFPLIGEVKLAGITPAQGEKEIASRLSKGGFILKGIGGEDGYSGFTMRAHDGTESSTGLDELLRDNAIEKVVIVGLALDYCVKSTALDAVERGYGCAVVREATAPVEVSPGDGAAAEAELAAAGVGIT